MITAPRPATPACILVVEDQDDVRLMLVTVLRMEGYDVEEASNALDGLQALAAGRFDLVLTDYAMPGGTGTWMLQEAARDGRLEGVPALVVTAHPELVRPATRFTVVSKPIDLDRFLEQVRMILKVAEAPRRKVPRPRPGRARIELVLYVNDASPSSIQAQANMERVLDAFDRCDIAYSTCDLQRNPEAAEHDRVVFTPTLVKRHPEPRMWIVGDLRDGDVVSDLLKSSGVRTL
ncbi:MAG: response regulator [Vicinamibacterales bacterium]